MLCTITLHRQTAAVAFAVSTCTESRQYEWQKVTHPWPTTPSKMDTSTNKLKLIYIKIGVSKLATV